MMAWRNHQHWQLPYKYVPSALTAWGEGGRRHWGGGWGSIHEQPSGDLYLHGSIANTIPIQKKDAGKGCSLPVVLLSGNIPRKVTTESLLK